jgi:hypothetical protein
MSKKIIELPKGQKDIIINALVHREEALKEALKRGYEEKDQMDIEHELFDILCLKAFLGYKTTIVLTEPQVEHFTAINGVDIPTYIY